VSDERTRTDPVASNDDVRIVGYRAGSRRTLIIVYQQTFEVDVFDSELLRDQLRARVDQDVPADLRDAVIEWLERPSAA
jgi:hypothetical protein